MITHSNHQLGSSWWTNEEKKMSPLTLLSFCGFWAKKILINFCSGKDYNYFIIYKLNHWFSNSTFLPAHSNRRRKCTFSLNSLKKKSYCMFIIHFLWKISYLVVFSWCFPEFKCALLLYQIIIIIKIIIKKRLKFPVSFFPNLLVMFPSFPTCLLPSSRPFIQNF